MIACRVVQTHTGVVEVIIVNKEESSKNIVGREGENTLYIFSN